MNQDRFEFPAHVWINVLIDFAIAYRDQVWELAELLDSLIPIYLGKTLSFVKKTERMSVKEAEEFIEEECVQFEGTKGLLLKRWNTEANQ